VRHSASSGDQSQRRCPDGQRPVTLAHGQGLQCGHRWVKSTPALE